MVKFSKYVVTFRQKCKIDPLTFSLFHFSPLTFNCCQFDTPLNSSYVMLLIGLKQRRFCSLKKKNRNLKKKKSKNNVILAHLMVANN